MDDQNSSVFQMIRIFLMLLLTTIVGMFGFHLIEGWGYFDALYMAIITLTTVGYSELHPLSDQGRLFVMVYLVGGVGISLYGIARLGEIFLRTQFFSLLGRRRMEKDLKKLSNHFIICGFGRVGEHLLKELTDKNHPVMVIDRNPQVFKNLPSHYATLEGDATDDQILIRAGLERAKGLAVVFGNDAENLYVVLSARLLKKDLQIISRASQPESVSKLYKAGANRVVSPYSAGAAKIARILTYPGISEIFDWHYAGKDRMEMAEILINDESPYKNKTLSETDYQKKGVMIVAIRRSSGELIIPPDRETNISVGDALIALGKEEAVKELFC